MRVVVWVVQGSGLFIPFDEIFVITPVKHDQSEWERMNDKGSKATHTILGLWSLNKMKRYDLLIDGFRNKRELLFKIYEEDGGEYHGPETEEDTTSPSRGKRRRVALNPNDDIFEEQVDSDDEDFA